LPMSYHLGNLGLGQAQLVFTVVIDLAVSSDSFHFTAVPYPIHPIARLWNFTTEPSRL